MPEVRVYGNYFGGLPLRSLDDFILADHFDDVRFQKGIRSFVHNAEFTLTYSETLTLLKIIEKHKLDIDIWHIARCINFKDMSKLECLQIPDGKLKKELIETHSESTDSDDW